MGSVMSWLGAWRYFLTAVTDLDEVVGAAAAELTLRSGDLRHVADDPAAHICQMFRWSDIEALLERTGGRSIGASASNWTSLGDGQALARLEADAERWARFLEHEVAACAQPGAPDGGTHILFAAAADTTRGVAPPPALAP